MTLRYVAPGLLAFGLLLTVIAAPISWGSTEFSGFGSNAEFN